MKYPLGVQDFAKIIKRSALYVDKTALVLDLIEQHEMVFLSRPRRFGKSVLISTFAALFSGQKALFDGLAISQTDYDFPEHPVIEFSFTRVDVTQADDLKQYIINTTNTYAKRLGITLTIDSYEQRFAELVENLPDGVVLLIDEYDKPLLDNLKKPALQGIKHVMRNFYSTVKGLDRYLHFVFITGVSKFAKVSVFSGMNTLTDISMNKRYATLCGITQQELEHHFVKAIDELASQTQLTQQQMLDKIKYWYNGYYFHQLGISVYNPYSLLSLFIHKEFRNFWYTTATPTFLMDLLQDKEFDLKNLSQFEIGESAFDVCEPEDMDVLSLFVQTGYLTIKGFNDPLYVLDFPNYEVKKSFFDSVATRFSCLANSRQAICAKISRLQ